MRTRCFFESIHSGADCKRRIRHVCQSTVRTVNANAVAVWIQHKQKFSQPVNRDQTALEPVRERRAGQNSQRTCCVVFIVSIEAENVDVKKVFINTNGYLSGYLESGISSKMEQFPRGEERCLHSTVFGLRLCPMAMFLSCNNLLMD